MITVFEGDILLGETVADDNGEWVVILEKTLAPGQHLVSVAMASKKGFCISQLDQKVVSLLIQLSKVTSCRPGLSTGCCKVLLHTHSMFSSLLSLGLSCCNLATAAKYCM